MSTSEYLYSPPAAATVSIIDIPYLDSSRCIKGVFRSSRIKRLQCQRNKVISSMFGPRAHIRITTDFSPPRYEPNLATPPHIPPSAIGADSTRPRHPFNFPHSFWLRSQLGGPTAGVRSCLRVRARRRSRSPFWAIVLSRFRLNSPECAARREEAAAERTRPPARVAVGRHAGRPRPEAA